MCRSLLSRLGAVIAVLVPALTGVAQTGGTTGPGVPAFEVRRGYVVTLAAENFGRARFMAVGDDATLYVSSPSEGKIFALKDTDKDGVYETKQTFMSDYPQVHGLFFSEGWLYATSAEDGSCKRARDTDGDGKVDKTEVVLEPGSVPAGGGHSFRGIAISEKYIYISVSDPSNMTADLPSDRKCVYRFDRDGKNKMQFATGIRNTEKLQLRPGTDELWGVDHGSDQFGGKYGERGGGPITDVLPGEEFNLLQEGKFYGHPFLSNNRIVRPEYAGRKDILDLAAATVPPAWIFGAHWAGNGWTFLTSDKMGMKGDAVVAFHGSWNSSRFVGYRVERVLFDDQTGQPFGSQRLVSTLEKSDKPKPPVLARPVDCVEAPDGTVLFSCDKTNRIYRISKADEKGE